MSELWVGNLRPDVTCKEIEEEFLRFGPVEQVSVRAAASGQTYAFVRFSLQAHAVAASAELSGVQSGVSTGRLALRWAQRSNQTKLEQPQQQQRQQAAAVSTGNGSTVWVGNLLVGTTSEQVRAHFDQLAPGATVETSRGPSNRDFAFVRCADAAAACLLISQMDGVVVPQLSGSKPLRLKPSRQHVRESANCTQYEAARPRQLAPAPGREVRNIRGLLVGDMLPASPVLWVGNVGHHATLQQINDLFNRFGTVMDSVLFPAHRNTRHQFAFVKMGTPQQAALALRELNALETLDICLEARLKIRFAILPNHGDGCLPKPPTRSTNGGSKVAFPGNAPHAPGASTAATVAANTAAEQAQEHAEEALWNESEEQGTPDRAENSGEEASSTNSAPTHASRQQATVGAPVAHARCCMQCGTADAKLQKCTGCYAAMYCSRDCQTADWSAGHRVECSKLKALSELLVTHPEQTSLLLDALRSPGSRLGRMVDATAKHAAAKAAMCTTECG